MSRGERKAMIRCGHPELSLSRQCKILSISRSSFYYAAKGERAENLALMRRIDALYLKYPFYGSRQMVRQLRRDGVRAGRHRVRRLMRLMGLEAIYQVPRTSAPHPEHRIYPYLLKGLAIDRPDQVWCADITYIPVSRGFLYLVAIMDWATRHVLSWRLSNTMDAGFCVEALAEALARYGRPEISSTDQGSQLTSLDVTALLKDAGVAISMDRRGRSMDNLRRTYAAPLARRFLLSHRAARAHIRGGLPARVDGRLPGRTRDRPVDRLLQHRAAPFRPRGPDADGSPPRRAARG